MSADPRLRARAQQQQPMPVPPPPPPPPAEALPMAVDGASDAPSAPKPTVPNDTFKLKFCTVCASNQNR